MKQILFNTDMVRAILDGRKTVTRRVIKPQPTHCTMSKAGLVVSEKPIEISDGIIEASNAEVRKPPFETGDILYVRETWCKYGKLDENDRLIEGTEQYYYRADGENPTPFNDFLVQHPGWDEHRETPVWHPSIHMPKEAARLFLRVTDVRAERLQKMTIEDFRKEGIKREEAHGRGCHCQWATEICREEPCSNRDAYEYLCWAPQFKKLWDSTIDPLYIGLYAWRENPWVWVISFERISKEEAERAGT